MSMRNPSRGERPVALGNALTDLRARWRSGGLAWPLYCASLVTWLYVTILSTSFFAAYIPYRYVRWALFGVLAVAELAKGSWSRRSVAAWGIAALVLFANFGSTNTTLIDVVLYAVVGRSFDQKRTARVCLYSLAAALATVIVSCDLGLIEDVVEGGDRIREYVGFSYALFPAQYGFAIACLLAYIRSERFSWADLLLSVGLNLYLYARTLSRLSMLLAVAVAVATFAFASMERCRRRKERPVNVVMRALGIIAVVSAVSCAVLSVAVTVAFDPSVSWMSKLNSDSLFAGRLRFGQDAIHKYGVPILGQHLELVGNGLDADGMRDVSGAYSWVDCMYVKMLVEDGLVVSLAFIVLATMVGWHAWRTRDVGLMVAVAACAAHGMVDQLCLSLQYNPLLLLATVPFAEGAASVKGDAVRRSFPRIARALPSERRAQMGLRQALSYVGRGWVRMAVGGVVCVTVALAALVLAPASYRVEARLVVGSGQELNVEKVARPVVRVAQTGDVWLTAGANDASGAVFFTTQGPDADRCEEVMDRALDLTKFYAARSALTNKVQIKVVRSKAQELRPLTKLVLLDSVGMGVCAGIVATAILDVDAAGKTGRRRSRHGSAGSDGQRAREVA